MRYYNFTDLKEIIHYYCPISNIGLNNIEECGTVQTIFLFSSSSRENRFQSLRTSSISTELHEGRAISPPRKQKTLTLLSTVSIEEDISLQEEDNGILQPHRSKQSLERREQRKSFTVQSFCYLNLCTLPKWCQLGNFGWTNEFMTKRTPLTVDKSCCVAFLQATVHGALKSNIYIYIY